ncbi:MAG: NAD(P)/FAD-dependent oxidoreductase, partial [Parasphingopyxis sp.]
MAILPFAQGIRFCVADCYVPAMREVDILVIGAGIAGLSAAARFAGHGETVVIEAEEAPGYHASGRSVTFCHFGIGDPLVKRLTSVSRATFAAPPEPGETPIARRHPALHIARADQKAELDALESIHRTLSPDYRRMSGAEAAEIVPLRTGGEDGIAHALFDPDGYKLDAHAMLQRHLRALRAAGGEL